MCGSLCTLNLPVFQDFWEVPMLVETRNRPVRYPKTVWAFFMIIFMFMSIVISNLFVAVCGTTMSFC